MRYCLNNHLPNGKAALQSSVKKRDEQRFCRNRQKGLALFVQSAIITASQNTNGTKGSRTCKSTAAPFRYAQRRAAHHRAVRLLFWMNIIKRGHTMKKRNRVLALTVAAAMSASLLAGCGSSAQQGGAASSEAASTDTAASVSDGGEDNIIRVGVVCSMSMARVHRTPSTWQSRRSTRVIPLQNRNRQRRQGRRRC